MNMAKDKYAITPEGLADLKQELERLKTIRLPEVAEKLNQARSNEAGDMEDNLEYAEALKERAFITGRIGSENILGHARVMSRELCDEGTASVGCNVTVRYQDGKMEMYHIVGSAEVNRGQGQISNESPVGRALMGKKAGDKIEVTVPSGSVKLEIIAVD